LLGDNDAKFVQRVYSDGLEKYVNRIKAVGFVDQKRVLDAGCGFGQWSLALAAVNDHIVSCDILSERIAFLSDIAAELGVDNIDTRVSGIESLPFPDASFDLIFCYGVIFLTPWRHSLKELHRVLKPEGSLYVNANGLGWYIFLWREEHNKAADYDPKARAAKAMQDTLYYEREGVCLPNSDLIIEPDDLKSEMHKLGFKNIKIAGEGHLYTNRKAARPVPFFKSKYYGLPGVFEALGVSGSNR
jgi:ubiquinone/menaquinone biosynthesis C-methylase UbiE